MANPAAARDYKLEKAGTTVVTKQGKRAVRTTKTQSPKKEKSLAELIASRGVGGSLSDVEIKKGGQNDTLLAWAIDDRGLNKIDDRLLQEAKNILVSSEAGSLAESNKPSLTNTISNSLLFTAPIAPGISPLSPALTGAALGGAGGIAVGGDLTDALKGAALGFAGGSLKAPIESGFGSTLSQGIYNAGQGVLNFLDPVIPDFIRSPGGVGGQTPSVDQATSVGELPNPLEGLDASFTPPDFDSLPNLSLGSPSLEDALTNFTSPETLGLTIPAVPYVPGQIPDVTFDAPDFTVKPEDVFTGPSEPSLSSKIGDAIKAGKPETLQDYLSIASSVPGVVGLIGGALSGPTGGDAEERPAVYAPGTFTEGNVADYEPSSHGSPQAVTISRSAYNRASPFRKQLLENAINTGKLIIKDAQNVGGQVI